MAGKVGIAALKAKLSAHLRTVRRGGSLTVVDRGAPIARIVPFKEEPLPIHRASRHAREIAVPPAPANPTDSLSILLEDRRRR